MGPRWRVALLIAVLSITLCLPEAAAKDDEPEVVVVQHILIAYKRSVPNKEIARSRKEARALAESLFARAKAGEDFDALVKEYTDDRYPGIMRLTNKDAERVAGATPRDGVVPRFGDVAFRLEVGEIELAAHHAMLSRFGWHLIKRLE